MKIAEWLRYDTYIGMWVRAGKQHTTQTNRLGTCNGKPEENLEEIGRTTQSRDWTFSCGPWRGEGKEGTPNPHKYMFQDNGAWPEREVFHGEEMSLWWERWIAVSFPCPYTWDCCKWCARQRGWESSTSHLTQPERPRERSKQHETLPLPWRDTRSLPRTSRDWARMEEKLENKEGPEENCSQPGGLRVCEHREQHPPVSTHWWLYCSSEAAPNLNTTEIITEH